jgi:UDP-N-acetyl-D-mannosaminuronate dehydrogenase
MANNAKSKRHLVIGMGEIGRPLYNILSEHYNVHHFDQTDENVERVTGLFEIIHICFGHKPEEVDQYVQWIQDYKELFLAEDGLVIIHATVAVGVTTAIGAVHSPIRGQHKMMEKGIRTFTKFFGGARASEAADYFRTIGIKIMVFPDSRTTEAMKLFDTEYYHACIDFARRVKEYCDTQGLNYSEVYRLANETYNQGYIKLGYPEYVRPVLEPIDGPIGGHCVVPNSKLIKLSE